MIEEERNRRLELFQIAFPFFIGIYGMYFREIHKLY